MDKKTRRVGELILLKEILMNRFALMLMASIPAFASAQDIEVFGQPLGGVLGHKVQVCPRDLSEQTGLCWLGKPFEAPDGASEGAVFIPDKYHPSWLPGIYPGVEVNKDGVLVSMYYANDVLLWKNRKQIVAGISSRFGAPEEISYDGVYGAIWMPNGAKIQLGCVYEKCFLSLMSKAENLRVEEALKQRMERPNSL